MVENEQGGLFVQGFVSVAAFGRVYARRTTFFTWTALDKGSSLFQEFLHPSEDVVRQAHSARMTVVDENRGAADLFVMRRADPANVVPVAEREEGEHGYGSVFQRVDPTHEIEASRLNVLLDDVGDLDPDAHGLKMDRRKVQFYRADEFLAGGAAFLVGDDPLRDLQSPFPRDEAKKLTGV
jgi:hypothetical protein